MFKKLLTGAVLFLSTAPFCLGQLHWKNVDSLYGQLPASVHVFTTNDLIDGKPNIAFYVIADLKSRALQFTTDTTYQRRLTPAGFYEKNHQPLAVVNGTFFDFGSNRNLNAVIKGGKLVSYNIHTVALKGKDTLTYVHTFRSAIGINKKRNADVAWLYTDSSATYARAFQSAPKPYTDSLKTIEDKNQFKKLRKWKMQTAIAGGPVLVQNGEVKITNNEERMFGGKAIDDKHPRTAMGYTADGKLIILVVQGRSDKIAEGASLKQLARIMIDLGCVEALNLDGGGSSCLLVNGKETIQPSDKTGERPVPGVFIIQLKK
ncbi:MAG: phosphodiester glycosidase family protein [Lacibacter sp.]